MDQYDYKVEYYSDKSIVVRGEDTKRFKEHLKALGGKYNSRLRGGPGWIFPNAKEMSVRQVTEITPQKETKRNVVTSTPKDTELHKKVDNLTNQFETVRQLLQEQENRLIKMFNMMMALSNSKDTCNDSDAESVVESEDDEAESDAESVVESEDDEAASDDEDASDDESEEPTHKRLMR